MAKVSILMGSDSDLPVMSKAAAMLEKFGIDYEMKVISAHREPDVFVEYAKSAESKGIEVIIAGAGGAAHLPGMCAAMFQLPTPEIPAPFCRLYDEQGSDEEDWFAAASFSPRSDNDDSKHPVFVDDGFGKPVPASDVIQNRDGELSSRCSTSKELFDFNVKVAQNR